jgi:hypothetical protein
MWEAFIRRRLFSVGDLRVIASTSALAVMAACSTTAGTSPTPIQPPEKKWVPVTGRNVGYVHSHFPTEEDIATFSIDGDYVIYDGTRLRVGFGAFDQGRSFRFGAWPKVEDYYPFRSHDYGPFVVPPAGPDTAGAFGTVYVEFEFDSQNFGIRRNQIIGSFSIDTKIADGPLTWRVLDKLEGTGQAMLKTLQYNLFASLAKCRDRKPALFYCRLPRFGSNVAFG